MTTSRSHDLDILYPVRPGVGPNGRGLCRNCGEEVPEGRRWTWCSRSCVNAAMSECYPSWLRAEVWKRDRGVCATCGKDTFAEWLEYQSGTTQKWFAEHPTVVRGAWNVDHVVPLSEGGTNELANIRTLCRPCHKAETAELRRRQALNRAAAKPGQLPFVAPTGELNLEGGADDGRGTERD